MKSSKNSYVEYTSRTVKYVLLMGLPASGKTTFFNILVKVLGKPEKIPFKRIDDFSKIISLCMGKGLKDILYLVDGGFEIKNRTLLDVALRDIIRDLPPLERRYKLIFLEFSRANYVKSLNKFPKEILHKSIYIYVKCPFKTCFHRNESRKHKVYEDGYVHYVPSKVMKKYYYKDDFADLITIRRFPLLVVDNSSNKLEDLQKQVKKVIPLFQSIIAYKSK